MPAQILSAVPGYSFTPVEAIPTELLPLATVVTPNLHEAEVLTGLTVSSLEGMREAARCRRPSRRCWRAASRWRPPSRVQRRT
jgi:hypothetical protein